MSLNQQPDKNNKASSRIICNRLFDKQRRKRSSRGGGGRHKPNNFHSTHCPIDLSSRNVAPEDETTSLSKGPLSVPYPCRDINWHKCRFTGSHLLIKSVGQIFILIVTLETFLATLIF